MKQNIATTPEQGKRLISCWVDPKTADMYWNENLIESRLHVLLSEWNERFSVLNDSPAWSLGRLLDMLPSPIYTENRKQFSLNLKPTSDCTAWVCEYEGHSTCLYQTNGETAIEACVRMVAMLTREGHELNSIKE